MPKTRTKQTKKTTTRKRTKKTAKTRTVRKTGTGKQRSGRPSKWDRDGRLCKAVEASAAAGGSPADFAVLLDVDVRTIYRWLDADNTDDYKADLAEAVARGREQATDAVERSLFQRAVGYETTDRHVTEDKDGIKTRTVTKVIGGDVTAQKVWLENRRPGRWRSRVDVKLGGRVSVMPVINITKRYKTDDDHDGQPDG